MKKLFTSNPFFIITFVITVIAQFALLVITSVEATGDFLNFSWITIALMLACEIAMFASYQNHNKNVMKGMIGAAFMSLVMDGMFETASSTGMMRACAGLYTFMAVVLLVNHLSLNSDRRARPKTINASISYCVLFAAVEILCFIIPIVNGYDVLVGICYLLANIGLAVTVVCIEAKLDAFRLAREAAGWTEEKGYPEGYVHEFEKKKK